jgi:hypothetical protein
MAAILLHAHMALRMSKNRDRFNKIIAVAVNPAAYEEEAISALKRARELVKQDRALAYPPEPPPPHRRLHLTVRTKLKSPNTNPLILPVMMSNLSSEAYGLGLKSKIEIEFVAGVSTYTLDVRCDGPRLPATQISKGCPALNPPS